MTQTHETPLFSPSSDEKVAKVVVYTSGLVIRGDLLVKKIIRVSTWLRTNNAPDWICLYQAKALVTEAGASTKPAYFKELHISYGQINAFHLLPPAQDPADYDPTEPNRRMQPVTALLGSFRVDGNLRLSMQTDLTKFLDVNRETFTPMYDAQVANPAIPSIGILAVPYLLVRQEKCVFAIQ